MNRHLRRATARFTREQATAWPAHLVEIPRGDWPPPTPGKTEYPIAVWRSRHYLVQIYSCEPYAGHTLLRLTVNRTTTARGGGWDQNIPWDDLQRCKREAGYGDWYAVEVYPRDRDVMNVANMRHLWLLAEPLSIGWFGE